MTHPVSIRRSLLVNLIAVVVVLAAAILAMTVISGRGSMQRFAGSLSEQTLARIEVELQRFFDPVSRQLETLSELSRTGVLDPDASETLDKSAREPHATARLGDVDHGGRRCGSRAHAAAGRRPLARTSSSRPGTRA